MRDHLGMTYNIVYVDHKIIWEGAIGGVWEPCAHGN